MFDDPGKISTGQQSIDNHGQSDNFNKPRRLNIWLIWGLIF